MAIKGLSMSEREEVILQSDPGHPDNPLYKAALAESRTPEKPTKFFIKPLSKGCRIELGDMGPSPSMKDGAMTMQLRNTQRQYAIVERALDGWDNLTDDAGQPIQFLKGTIQTPHGFVAGASTESMQRLPQSLIAEISIIVLRKNGMSRELLGNSEVPSLQPAAPPSENGPAMDALLSSNENAGA